MTLGSSALGQFTLGGTGYEAASGTNYVNIAATVAIASSISAALSITGIAGGTVSIAASITIVSSLSASLGATAAMPEPGVSFTISDQAGGV